MSGGTLSARVSGGASAVLTYIPTIPEALYPLLVLDASGRVKGTYELMEKRGGFLKRIGNPTKDYRNLTVRVWQHSSGKGTWQDSRKRNERERVMAGIIQELNANPDEVFLIVHHKYGKGQFDLRAALRKAVVNPDRLHFETWGRITATNRYAHIPNIMLVSAFHQPDSVYEAEARLAAQFPPEFGPMDLEDIKRVRQGELLHHTLQAACRGAIRCSEGDGCKPSRLWVIVHQRTGLKALLPAAFPGCEIKDWTPLRGCRKEPKRTLGVYGQPALEYLCAQREAGRDRVPTKELREEVGCGETSAFSKLVLRNPAFRQELEQRGMRLLGNVRVTGIALLPS